MRYVVTELARGLGFIEGPVVRDDGSLLFTDIGRGCILRRGADGSIDVFADVGGGPNGLAEAIDGSLIVCNNGGMGFAATADGSVRPDGTRGAQPIDPCIQRIDPDGRVQTIVGAHSDGPLRSPNDLVVDTRGGFYFTDFGAVDGRVLDPGGVYYVPSAGEDAVASELLHSPNPTAPPTRPNGIGISPDGGTLYIAETPTGRLWSWEILEPGVLAAGPRATAANGATLVHSLTEHALFDSLAVDGRGCICVATVRKGGISVITPDGRLDAFIELPLFDSAVTNICFSPAGDTAYVTAAGTGRLYAIDWPEHTG